MKEEEPCLDGQPCSWLVEEHYEADGSQVIDTYCGKCFRFRDWTKNERKAS